jgi:hypothetical protein
VADPVLYASPRQFIGLALETQQGTPLVPAVTVPVNNFDPFDQPTWLDDAALRGSMTEPYNRVAGPIHTEFSFGGPAYFDTFPYLLNNLLGDAVYSGTYTGSGTTTLASSSTVGATSISTAATIAASTLIQIDTGTLSEVRLTTGVTGSGPFTVSFATPLVNAHNSAVTVKPITAPYTDVFSTYNTGTGQPGSLTITDWQGPTATTQARAYAGCCLSALNIKGTPESSTIMYDAQGMGWPSAPAVSAPTSNPSAKLPQPSWETTIGLNGTVGGAQIKTISDFEIDLARALKIYYTAQGSQNPYFIQRGRLTVTGKLNFVVANETPLTYLLQNTQPQLQLVISNGLATTNLLSMQVDMQQAAFTTSKISRANAAVEYAVEFAGIANTTNAGWSGGFSPIAITMQNAVAPNAWPYF